MKVAISVGGRFHAFNLANELEKCGHLLQLITSYPAFKAAEFGVPKEKVSSVILKEIIERSWRKLPHFLRKIWNPQYFWHTVYDRGARRRLSPETEIFVGWSSCSLRTMRKAKKLGALTILERGSSHIEYQKKILEEEYARWGMKPKELPHPKIVQMELKEYAEADYISVPSLFVKRTFLEKGFPESKLIHVPYGVDLSSFRQIPKTDDVFRVVYAGGMGLRKGLPYLLQAFAELELPNSELVLVGTANPEIEPFFQKYSGKFRHVGHVPQAELYKYYSQGSVFVLPSLEEGMAMMQLQAMACGLPLIITPNTGGEDVVRDGKDGFIVPIRDVEAIKEKISYLHAHPAERANMGRSAKERVASGFTWNDYGTKITEAYSDRYKTWKGGA